MSSANSKRIEAMDSVRGSAMILVCLSHFTTVYSVTSKASLEPIFYLTMIAAPTFMIISGIMLGYFFVAKRDGFHLVQRRFINRGVFILTVSRILISSAHILYAGGVTESLKNIYITDTIGLNIILGPLLIGKLGSRARVAIGILGMLVDGMVITFWDPQNQFLLLLKEAIFGESAFSKVHVLNYAFPFLPWFSLYFLSTGLGEKMGRHLSADRSWELGSYFRRVGCLAVAAAVLIKSGYGVMKYSSVFSQENIGLYSLTSPFQKSPPSAVYFLFYGGLGLLLIPLLCWMQKKRSFAWYLKYTCLLGRNSLFVFMLQYFLYFTILLLAQVQFSIFWPCYFILSILFILFLANFWEAMNLNRLLAIRILAA